MDLSHPCHCTAMQVAGGKTAGLDFHLARLDAVTRELFGVGGQAVGSGPVRPGSDTTGCG